MNDNEMTIQREDGDTDGRYVIKLSPSAEAEMTYRKTDKGIMIIDHTGVPDDWRGQGVGKALVQRAVEDARARKIQIVPLCPFAKAQIDKTPDWQDVLKPASER